MNAFYMNYIVGENAPTYRHAELAIAKAEALRLCEKTGREVFTLKCIASIKPTSKFVETEFTDADDFPY